MRISVGICTHNGERYIAEQLFSILNQTVKPNEIVVSDDNSNDSTVLIVKKVLAQSSISYKIIENKNHVGIRKNFEAVFSMCSGDYIFSCDQDDIWFENKIESFLPYFEKGYDFIYSNSIVVDSERNLLHDNYWACYGVDFSEITIDEFRFMTLTNRTVSGYNLAFSRELLLKVLPFPDHFIHDDWIAICSSWLGSIAFISKPLAEYRIHSDNTSRFGQNKVEDMPSSGGLVKKKRLFPEVYYTSSPEAWFGTSHMYLASAVFYERMQDVINKRFKRTTKRYICFRRNLLKCTPKNRFIAIMVLFVELLTGRYFAFRGGLKTFIRDVLFLLLNQNTQFEYNLNIW